MNGRIYDPTLGRFLQADPHIQAPGNSQSYNRYSYVLNNPLSYTDPSGYFFDKLLRPFKNVIRGIFKAIGKEASQFLINLGSSFCGPAKFLCEAVLQYDYARAFGASSSGALRGAFTAGVSSYIGMNTGSGWEGRLVHATSQGIIEDLSGGKFGHGFWRAGLNPGPANTGNPIVNVLIDAVVGGSISEVTGGKFKNGASSAAFFSIIRQDWSSSSKRLVEGSPEWEEREQAAMDAEIAAIEASFVSGDDLYAGNWDWMPNPQQCKATCIDFYYGDSYDIAGYVSPLSIPSVASAHFGNEIAELLKREGERNSYSDHFDFQKGQRQLKTLRQFNTFSKGAGKIGIFGLGYQIGANAYCELQCNDF